MQEETVGLRERPGSAQERLIPTLKDRAAADDASPTPQDLEVQVPSTPHALADLARAIGDAGVSLEEAGCSLLARRTTLSRCPTLLQALQSSTPSAVRGRDRCG